MTKQSKKILLIIIIAVVALIAVSAIFYFTNNNGVNNGVYYSQQGTGKYLQFKSDKTFTFAYNPQNDLYSKKNQESNIEAEIISTGKWKESGNKITVTFDDGEVIFVKADDYIYREDAIYIGKPNDEKLLNNRFVIKEDDKVVEELWFLNDGTVDHKVIGDSNMRHGTYTREGDILTVRFDDLDFATRFLVIDNGITKEIYAKNPVKN